ncbi:DNA-3-methyladenine glycosylase [Clostridium akagii]|uniref:DNA-3-methyladenine glycosylase n=1 Tax=Clostridium akagii TaxID=91623 RepID=UPI00047AEDBC|nr:DNA-3-methyladenine glycosylase [Clostridium akagii]
MNKINREFFQRNTITVAKELLGKVLVHEIHGLKLAGKIVETEAYLGLEDKAAHSFGGKRTPRVEVMYGKAGISYIYLIYGMYYCFNVITRKEDIPEGVLIRALEPLEGFDEMAVNRFNTTYDKLTKLQVKNLTNGPGKLCIAMTIDKSLNKNDMCVNNNFYIADYNFRDFEIVSTKRIGIDYAEEYKDLLWRFYIKDNINKIY